MYVMQSALSPCTYTGARRVSSRGRAPKDHLTRPLNCLVECGIDKDPDDAACRICASDAQCRGPIERCNFRVAVFYIGGGGGLQKKLGYPSGEQMVAELRLRSGMPKSTTTPPPLSSQLLAPLPPPTRGPTRL